MQDGKMIVSTPVDADLLARLDAFRNQGGIHRTRAEILRGLLYALLIEGKQEIFEKWRSEVR